MSKLLAPHGLVPDNEDRAGDRVSQGFGRGASYATDVNGFRVARGLFVGHCASRSFSSPRLGRMGTSRLGLSWLGRVWRVGRLPRLWLGWLLRRLSWFLPRLWLGLSGLGLWRVRISRDWLRRDRLRRGWV